MKIKDITLRDYFAAHALTGLMANPNLVKQEIFNKRPHYYALVQFAIDLGEEMVHEGIMVDQGTSSKDEKDE
jgi:hypothetical protein